MRKRTSGGRLQLRFVIGGLATLVGGGEIEEGCASGRLDRKLELADRRQIVEVVGAYVAASEGEDTRHEGAARNVAAHLPIEPDLTNGTDGGRRRVERHLRHLAFAPHAQRMIAPRHIAPCKVIAYIAAIPVRDREPIFVSAEILQFLPMFTDPNRIRELRRLRDWSQQKLADLVGVSKVTISDLELGKMALTLDYMRRVSSALSSSGDRVSPADLLTVEDNPYLPRGDDERDLVEDYRSADELQREIIRRVAKPTDRSERAA